MSSPTADGAADADGAAVAHPVFSVTPCDDLSAADIELAGEPSTRRRVPYVTMPGHPSQRFLYFNMHAAEFADWVTRGAALVHAHLPANAVLVTAETATLEMTYLLRTQYGRTVVVMSKKPRPDAGARVLELSASYRAVTSPHLSTLHVSAQDAAVLAALAADTPVFFFDNVVTSGGTAAAAEALVFKATGRRVLDGAVALFSESLDDPGRAFTKRDVAWTTFGHLPILRQDESRAPPSYFHHSTAEIPSTYGPIRFSVFTSSDGRLAVAVAGRNGADVDAAAEHPDTPLPVRVHDACMTSENFGSLKCDCREQLEAALRLVSTEGGLVIYLMQEGRGIGLANKVAAYALQVTQGMDTVEANRALSLPDDCRVYVAARDILAHYKVPQIALLTNNPRKVERLTALGVRVSRRPLVVPPASEQCRAYLQAKAARMAHLIPQSELADRAAMRFYEPDAENGILSNFARTPFTLDAPVVEAAAAEPRVVFAAGTAFPTVEHAYQACKAAVAGRPDVIEHILRDPNPRAAFHASRQGLGDAVPEVWGRQRVDIMRFFLRHKFAQAPSFKGHLLGSGEALILESSPVDNYWGTGPDGDGINMLGQLLMDLRGSDPGPVPASQPLVLTVASAAD